MTPILTRFKTLGLAALVAAALGTAGLSATPAFAQNEPPSGFSLNVPQPTEAPPVNPNTGKMMAPQGGDNGMTSIPPPTLGFGFGRSCVDST